MHAYALKARYLFPIDGPPIPDGVLTLADDRIVAVGENVSGNVPRDLGNVAVLPGLINAHAHLEFSDLPSPLGRPGMAFTDWLAAVVTWRRQQLAETDSVERRYRAAERGLDEVARTGTAAVGEIASPGWPEAAFQASPVDTTVFLELLGLAPQRVEPLLASAAAHLANPASPTKWRGGLAPHCALHDQPGTAGPNVSAESPVSSAGRVAPGGVSRGVGTAAIRHWSVRVPPAVL